MTCHQYTDGSEAVEPALLYKETLQLVTHSQTSGPSRVQIVDSATNETYINPQTILRADSTTDDTFTNPRTISRADHGLSNE